MKVNDESTFSLSSDIQAVNSICGRSFQDDKLVGTPWYPPIPIAASIHSGNNYKQPQSTPCFAASRRVFPTRICPVD